MHDATDDRRHRWRPRNRKLVAGSLLLALLAGTALVAPLLAPFDPLAQDLHATLLGPSTAHPLGTDALGRDALSRLLFGARLSLAIGAIATAASLLLGTGIGMLAGYGGPLVDEVVSRAIDVFLAFPGLLLAIAGAVSLKSLKHGGHIAALVGLVGFLGTAKSLGKVPALLSGETVERAAAVGVQAAFAVLSLIFVTLCVKSFIDARRARNSNPS